MISCEYVLSCRRQLRAEWKFLQIQAIPNVHRALSSPRKYCHITYLTTFAPTARVAFLSLCTTKANHHSLSQRLCTLRVMREDGEVRVAMLRTLARLVSNLHNEIGHFVCWTKRTHSFSRPSYLEREHGFESIRHGRSCCISSLCSYLYR